jgi:hypothetical protein
MESPDSLSDRVEELRLMQQMQKAARSKRAAVGPAALREFVALMHENRAVPEWSFDVSSRYKTSLFRSERSVAMTFTPRRQGFIIDILSIDSTSSLAGDHVTMVDLDGQLFGAETMTLPISGSRLLNEGPDARKIKIVTTVNATTELKSPYLGYRNSIPVFKGDVVPRLPSLPSNLNGFDPYVFSASIYLSSAI